MTRISLFGTRGSGSAAVEMALRAVGEDYRLMRASSWEPDSALPELLRVNPLGQIPTLVLQDGTVLTESAAILIHLALAHPEAGLLPAEPSARALALRGLVFIAANCYSAVSISDYPERWTTATTKPSQVKVREAARLQLHRAWEIFADTFGHDALLTNPHPGALAFLTVVVSRWSGARQHLRAARPEFHEALMALEAHPAIAPVLREHSHA
jgi:GST-like protein